MRGIIHFPRRQGGEHRRGFVIERQTDDGRRGGIFALTSPLRLAWTHLYRQFGSDPAKAGDKRTVDAFRTKCQRELKKIKISWPAQRRLTE